MTRPTSAELHEAAHQSRRIGRARAALAQLRLVPATARWPDWIRPAPQEDEREEERAP